MLILSRKDQESIYIGESVVTVIDICGERVKLGITAPKTIKVLRGEIVESDQFVSIPPEDRTKIPVVERLRRMNEVNRQKTISAIIMEFCAPKKFEEATCQS